MNLSQIKKISLISFLLLSASSVQAESVYTNCITEFPTTSFFIETEKDIVQARIIMHGGTQFGPFWQGIVVPNDLKLLTEYANEFVKLDHFIEIKWKIDQCTWEDENFYCSGQVDPVKSGSQIVDPWSLYSSHVTEKNFAGKYDYIQLNFNFSMNGVNYNIPMKYFDYECKIGKAPLLAKNLKKDLKSKKK